MRLAVGYVTLFVACGTAGVLTFLAVEALAGRTQGKRA